MLKSSWRFVVLMLIGWAFPLLAVGQQAEVLFKRAGKALQAGNVEAARGLYEQVLTKQPDHAAAHMQMGGLHLQAGRLDQAFTSLRRAQAFSPQQLLGLTLLMAETLHRASRFDSAAVQYQYALRATNRKDYDQQDLIRKRLQECEAGALLQSQPAVATVQNLGPAINSPFADHVPVLADQEGTLIFTSRRAAPAAEVVKGKPMQVNENVYFAKKQERGWGPPQRFDAPVNGPTHSSVLSVSADGKELFLYKTAKRGGLYHLRKTAAGNWGEPEPLKEPFNSASFDPSLSISDDGEYAFFSSDREGGLGGLDLYITFRQEDGSWSEAMNLGPAVNTPFDEDAPYIDSRNSVLYFSSRGHNTMGGYDIFKSTIEGSLWSQAENMGKPVNTPFDDIYFVLMADEKHGYFASDRPGGLGEKDIYLATLNKPGRTQDTGPVLVQADPEPDEPGTPEKVALPVKAETNPASKKTNAPPAAPATFSLGGVVTDAATGKPLAATITVFDPVSRQELARVGVDSLQGSFALNLKPGPAYELQATKAGYFFYSAVVRRPAGAQGGSRPTTIALRKIKVGDNLVLHSILFEFNKLEFKAESLPELDRIHGLLVQNPHLVVQISGHTDNRGSEQINQRVSEQRARAVVEYLVAKGIAPERLRALGYGLSRPIAPNDTEAGRQRNRRTEFLVLDQNTSANLDQGKK